MTQALRLGLPSIAVDIARTALAVAPGHRQLQYLHALALARTGSTASAAAELGKLLGELSQEDPLYVDAVSLAGRVAKDRWSRLPVGPARTAAGEEARRAYREAYDRSGHYFPGINAATMCLMTGDDHEAARIAREVQQACHDAVSGGADQMWLHATAGEAHTLLGNLEQAKHSYGAASTLAARNYGDMAAMRRQLRLIASVRPGAAELLSVVHVPRVVTFSGHMIDASDRRDSRFPPALEHDVRRAIATAIDALQPALESRRPPAARTFCSPRK